MSAESVEVVLKKFWTMLREGREQRKKDKQRVSKGRALFA